jgi:hypothetical protein
MKDVVEHRIVSENNGWTYGKTYINNTYFGDWTRYNKGGNPPTSEQLKAIEAARVLKADAYRQANPYTPTPEYLDAIKRYPLKGK